MMIKWSLGALLSLIEALVSGELIALVLYYFSPLCSSCSICVKNISAPLLLFGPMLSIMTYAFFCRRFLKRMKANYKSYPVDIWPMTMFLVMLYVIAIFFLVVLAMPYWYLLDLA
jgi:hypothetical protein